MSVFGVVIPALHAPNLGREVVFRTSLPETTVGTVYATGLEGRAARLDPDNSEANEKMGVVSLKQGQYNDALPKCPPIVARAPAIA